MGDEISQWLYILTEWEEAGVIYRIESATGLSVLFIKFNSSNVNSELCLVIFRAYAMR